MRDSRNRQQLAFVTHRAMFRFVVIHGHFEHIVAADADAMNLWLGLAIRAHWGLVVTFVALSLTHTPILARRIMQILSPAHGLAARKPKAEFSPLTLTQTHTPKKHLPRPRRQHRCGSVTIR